MTELDAQFTAALDPTAKSWSSTPGKTIFARCCSRPPRRSLLHLASKQPCQLAAMAADRRERDARYNGARRAAPVTRATNASDNGRARWLAYYNRREADLVPVNEVTDQHGNVHRDDSGDYFRCSERVRKAKYARRKRMAEGEAQIKEAELRVEARR